MHQLDYLSTVSGGGYIGTWLMGWVYRVNQRQASNQPGTAYAAVVRELAGDPEKVTSGDPAPRTLRHLREYTSFLAPSLGLTLDTWTLAAIVFRNLIVNWAMILPLVLLAVSIPQVMRYGLILFAHDYVTQEPLLTLLVAGALFCFAGVVAGFRMPSRLLAKSIGDGWEPWFVALVFVTPLIISTMLLAALWYDLRHLWSTVAWFLVPAFAVITFLTFFSVGSIRVFFPNNRNAKDNIEHSKVRYVFAVIGASLATGAILSFTLNALALHGGAWLEKIRSTPKEQTTQSTLLKSNGGSVVLTLTEPQSATAAAPSESDGPKQQGETIPATQESSPAVGSRLGEQAWVSQPAMTTQTPATGAASVWSFSEIKGKFNCAWETLRSSSATAPACASIPSTAPIVAEPEDRFVIWVFACIWTLIIAASALHSGFLGIFEEDIDREWWGRAGGLMFAVLLFWLSAEMIAIYGTTVNPHIQGLTFSGALTGLLAAIGGASTASGLKSSPDNKANVSAIGRFLDRFGLVLPTLSAIALLILTLLMARFEIWLAKSLGSEKSFTIHLSILLGSLVTGILVNWVVNVNIFSLHGMYRMRLMRAFLGASNVQRRPNPFTGFDERDSVYEADVPCGKGMPLHVINATVNLVGTRNLAWRQRKAEGFTISPLLSGSWRLAYVPTGRYGRKGGLSLATAMSISGAAFNPNMGYHSSPLVTLLMTLLNVRLGWWLPNPRYRADSVERPDALRRLFGRRWTQKHLATFLQKKAPRFALKPLLTEAFGMTDDRSAYIELTDGGHFENLGLYEMVMRRCHRIIVVDAGADPKCQFEDLGNALRKINIDLGIPIIFDCAPKMQAGASLDNRYCAVARICYSVVDGNYGKTNNDADEYADKDAERYRRDKINAENAALDGELIYIKAAIRGDEPPDVVQYSKTHDTFPHESTANQFFNESQFESYRHLGEHELFTIVRPTRDGKPVKVAMSGSDFETFAELAKAYVS